MIGIFVALLSGALMSIQGVFNTEVTRQSSIWVSAGWVQLTAFVTFHIVLATHKVRIQKLPDFRLREHVLCQSLTWTTPRGVTIHKNHPILLHSL